MVVVVVAAAAVVAVAVAVAAASAAASAAAGGAGAGAGAGDGDGAGAAAAAGGGGGGGAAAASAVVVVALRLPIPLLNLCCHQYCSYDCMYMEIHKWLLNKALIRRIPLRLPVCMCVASCGTDQCLVRASVLKLPYDNYYNHSKHKPTVYQP